VRSDCAKLGTRRYSARRSIAAFYKRESLPLCFNLRCVIPVIGTEQELQQRLAEEPRLIVIDPAEDDSVRAAVRGNREG
jgi:hypothetical protein